MLKRFLQTSPTGIHDSLKRISNQMEEANTEEKAKALGLPYINMHSFPADLNTLSLFSEEEARVYEAVPFFREHHELRVGAINPNNPALLARLEQYKEKYNITTYVISKSGLEYVLTFYAHVVTPKLHVSEDIKLIPTTDFAKVLEVLKDEKAQEAMNVSELVGDVFGVAMQFGASDIHIEPEEHLIKIRFRVDGVLQDMVHLTRRLQHALVSRIKIVSKLKLNVENLPQDGRITFMWGDNPVDVRVSTLPSAYGEGIVMRLLGVGAIELKLDDLGLTGRSYKIIETELQKPNGMIITTGPTGSGKTTTLYAFLNELNEPGVKIITIEDPVEYKLQGIQQTPIDHNVDFSFAKALRAILRQDPDIVMVGEIRDTETAETALQAALTGHIVLSTLHTNDSFGAVPRLITMGAKPFIIAPALNAVIAQRLVRRLCVACKTPVTLEPTLQEHVQKTLAEIPPAAGVELPNPLQFYRAPGCVECHNLGYKGRIGIYEVIHINDTMKDLILKNMSMVDLKKQAILDGTLTMAQDGLLKAAQGVTDVEEVFRVAGD
ncbi:MAG: type II/IV secretion system protein [Candidatus Doudnabacteria bacterium]|nr:type II/IV secretion system protein [Candidatus Doudnabacteria bacterium]